MNWNCLLFVLSFTLYFIVLELVHLPNPAHELFCTASFATETEEERAALYILSLTHTIIVLLYIHQYNAAASGLGCSVSRQYSSCNSLIQHQWDKGELSHSRGLSMQLFPRLPPPEFFLRFAIVNRGENSTLQYNGRVSAPLQREP